ncbi:restriction endonuclease fold toxin 5 domain-containing protein [Xenorhabdus sp. IM139775]|nr:restriction endonuclease fold toxin 5 domain-containing protein [Xenorhabdus sp. IM139775]MDC9595091.1 restriction endonuclease fold toxin 5 domain-containing protein [Xenorhabdus sp. IM139775]
MDMPVIALPAILGAAEYAASALAGILLGVGVGIGVDELTKDKEDEKDKAESDTKVITSSRTECEKCPAIGKVVMVWESTNGRSASAITYQAAIAKTIYDANLSRIESWDCLGVNFDGWQPYSCLFLEAKAKYDNFFKNGRPMDWWANGHLSMISQAERQQMVCSSLNSIPNSHWHFLQPVSFAYYARALSKFPNIKVFNTPL